jgi:hypothetical protein
MCEILDPEILNSAGTMQSTGECADEAANGINVTTKKRRSAHSFREGAVV